MTLKVVTALNDMALIGLKICLEITLTGDMIDAKESMIKTL